MAIRIPKIIHQIWIGDQSKRPVEMMDKVKKLHPNWQYRLWTEKEIFADVMDEEIFRAIEQNSTKPDFYAKLADIVRYIVLNKYGGFYIDADTEMLKPFDELIDNQFVACFEIDNLMVSNGVIGSVPNHPILTFCDSVIRGMFEKNPDMILHKKAWKITGPKLLTKAIEFCNEESMLLLDHKAFLPIHHSDFDTIEEYEKLLNEVGKESFCTTKWGHKDMYKVKSDRERFISYLRGQIQWLQQYISKE